MTSKVSKSLTDYLLKKNIIVQEEYEIYQFGMEQLIASTFSLISVLIIGIVLDVILESLIFIMAFKAIRECAGGYHASTRLRCYVLSMLTVITVLSVIKYIPLDTVVLIIMSVLASIIIILLSPVDTENKRIDAIERIYYRRKSMIILWVELIIAMICVIIHYEEGAKCIVVGLLVLAIAQIAENIKKLIKNRKEYQKEEKSKVGSSHFK